MRVLLISLSMQFPSFFVFLDKLSISALKMQLKSSINNMYRSPHSLCQGMVCATGQVVLAQQNGRRAGVSMGWGMRGPHPVIQCVYSNTNCGIHMGIVRRSSLAQTLGKLWAIYRAQGSDRLRGVTWEATRQPAWVQGLAHRQGWRWRPPSDRAGSCTACQDPAAPVHPSARAAQVLSTCAGGCVLEKHACVWLGQLLRTRERASAGVVMFASPKSLL